MAKVFRLFSDKDVENWQDRGNDYGPSVIEKIPNPDGDFSKREPTSIPSPFARIDLVRTAFEYVVDKNELEGNTIYHKLISDCLDVGEMFFKIDSLGTRAQIRWWDKNIDLNSLKNSANPSHRLYGETLDLFIKQDKETYNFDSLNKMFFIFYDFQIIGGTSPSTLFFTSGNDLSFTNINFGKDVLFDADLKALYKRDPEYQKYLHHFFKAYPELSSKMREFSDYLEKCLNLLINSNPDLYREIMQVADKPANILKQELDAIYDSLDTGTAGDNLEIIGCLLKKKKIKDRPKFIEENSDFVIRSSKYAGGHKPLVLQNNFSLNLNYTDSTVPWNGAIAVPYFDKETDINNRVLPGLLDKYPYLTVSDFLQPQIIRLVYRINKEKYWDGNIRFETGDKNKDFILPLTNKFFDFFDTTDLKMQMPDGKPMFEMIVYSGSVDVFLRIPIKGNSNYITFKRSYDNKGIVRGSEPDIKNNKGYIIENQFGLTLYPFLKTGNDENSFYRIMLVDRDIMPETKHNIYDLSFHKNSKNELVKYLSKKTRSSKDTQTENVTTNFFILEREFDYIEITHKYGSGIVIPLFAPFKNGTDEFTFAIDFGTTNTHIEYTKDYSRKTPKERKTEPFEITPNDVQIATLHDSTKEESVLALNAIDIYDLIPQEFLPEKIERDGDYKFPQRTILGYHKSLDTSLPSFSLADFNIPFVYEKATIRRGTEVKTNLKWSNYTLNIVEERKIEAFFEELMFLIRNKVLMNNGKLEDTKLIWFYPSSMIEDRRNMLEKIWIRLFKKYISTKSIPKKISESIAPFYYFKNKGGIDASDLPVAAIDIGGGTSDIVIYQNNKPQTLTSFRFAANAIFGDAYNGSAERNGFVLKYIDKIGNLIEANGLKELGVVLNTINSKQDSEDIATFLFSLESNKKIIEDQIRISFNEMLSKDGDMKIVFVIFYSALIYHLAKLMKINNYQIPRYITFSGTGSKLLAIADSNSKLLGLQKLTNIIFQKIYNTSESNIEIVQHMEPKEITCKGGLHSDSDVEIENIKAVLIGDKENDLIVSKSNSTVQGVNVTYENLNDNKLLNSVVDEVKSFIDLIFSINNDFNFSDKFGVNPGKLEDNKTILKEDLRQYLKSGIEIKELELRGKTNINLEESLFFYPLVGALNKLAFKIVTNP